MLSILERIVVILTCGELRVARDTPYNPTDAGTRSLLYTPTSDEIDFLVISLCRFKII